MTRLMTDRRSFLASSVSLAAASMVSSGGSRTRAAEQDSTKVSDSQKSPVCIFAKHLQLMPWTELAEFCREIEVDGIEATIRGGGQVEPQDAAEKMPQLSESLAATNTRIVVMTTDINSPESPHAEAVLRTAALLGVTHYRMAYYRYDLSQPLLPQLSAFARQANQLAKLNHELGLTGVYQNHAGSSYVGGPLWDLQMVLRDIPSSDIAVAYDVRHATVEGNLSWPIDLAMIRDRIGTVYVKDYRAVNGKIENVPLGEGDVSEALFKSLRQQPPPGPVSLHMEYISHTDPKQVAACADAYRKDRQTLRRLLGV